MSTIETDAKKVLSETMFTLFQKTRTTIPPTHLLVVCERRQLLSCLVSRLLKNII
jgi:hypothetical protein